MIALRDASPRAFSRLTFGAAVSALTLSSWVQDATTTAVVDRVVHTLVDMQQFRQLSESATADSNQASFDFDVSRNVTAESCTDRRFLVLPHEHVLETEWLDPQIRMGDPVSTLSPADRVAAIVMAVAGWLAVAMQLNRTLVISPPLDGSRYGNNASQLLVISSCRVILVVCKLLPGRGSDAVWLVCTGNVCKRSSARLCCEGRPAVAGAAVVSAVPLVLVVLH